LKHLYLVDKVPVPTRLDLEATTLLKMRRPYDDAEDPGDGVEALMTKEKP